MKVIIPRKQLFLMGRVNQLVRSSSTIRGARGLPSVHPVSGPPR
jgi:hypothetical protein